MRLGTDEILTLAGHVVLGALVVWREVRNESYACMLAVAYTLVTRTDQGRWGKGILGVIGAPKQYTSMTHPKDPQLTRFPADDDKRWAECLRASSAAMLGLEPNPMPEADCYHDTSITTPNTPEWQNKRRLGQIDRIIFFVTP
jgi:spore germination cell wall hydrolase CwlJ-like protein